MVSLEGAVRGSSTTCGKDVEAGLGHFRQRVARCISLISNSTMSPPRALNSRRTFNRLMRVWMYDSGTSAVMKASIRTGPCTLSLSNSSLSPASFLASSDSGAAAARPWFPAFSRRFLVVGLLVVGFLLACPSAAGFTGRLGAPIPWDRRASRRRLAIARGLGSGRLRGGELGRGGLFLGLLLLLQIVPASRPSSSLAIWGWSLAALSIVGFELFTSLIGIGRQGTELLARGVARTSWFCTEKTTATAITAQRPGANEEMAALPVVSSPRAQCRRPISTMHT